MFVLFVALDLVGLAKGFALPHLPRMPELRGLDASSFTPHPTAPREIRFKDKAREKQRKLKLENMEHGGTYISLCILLNIATTLGEEVLLTLKPMILIEFELRQTNLMAQQGVGGGSPARSGETSPLVVLCGGGVCVIASGGVLYLI